MMPQRIEPPDDGLDDLRSLGPVVRIKSAGDAVTSMSGTSTAGEVIAKTHIRVDLASAISTEPTDFIWEGWLERGAYAILAGVQGTGKTTWASHLVARLTRGEPLTPDDRQERPAMRVVWLSLEEARKRVVARLDAAGADLDRIHIYDAVEVHEVTKDGESVSYDRPWRMPTHTGYLEELIRDNDIDLAVIDGLGYSLENASATKDYGIVGQVLSELGKVAERTKSTILGLTHVPKGGGDAATAAIGSTAWTALARPSWINNQDEETRQCYVTIGKTNYEHPDPNCYEYEILPDPAGSKAGVISNIRASDASTHEVMNAHRVDPDKSALAETKEFILGQIREGDRLSKEITEEAIAELGVSKTTVDRARSDLKKARRITVGPLHKGGPWVLHLNETDLPPRDRQQLPLDRFRGSSDEIDDLGSDQDVSSGNAEFATRDRQSQEFDDLLVRDDPQPSDLEGSARTALARQRGGAGVTPSDVQALADVGVVEP